MSENENPFKILNQDISSTKELSPNDVQGNITERI